MAAARATCGLIARGEVNDTPILTGQTENKSSAMAPKWGNLSPQECKAAFARMSGAMADKFEAVYLKPEENCNTGLAQFQTDRGLFSAYQWVTSRLKVAKGPVYVYLYKHLEPGSDAGPLRRVPFFGHRLCIRDAGQDAGTPFTDKDRAISNTISDYWTNFVKTGNPNGAGLPDWPAANPDRQMLMETGDDPHARPALSPDKRKLLEEFVRQGGKVGMF